MNAGQTVQCDAVGNVSVFKLCFNGSTFDTFTD